MRTAKSLTAILALCLASVPLFATPPSGGGGGKVTVTAANPPDAFQGEELDVIVSGTGFDAGSSVSYLVTGTTDASQVEVISVQYVSSTELKTRIRPKDAALPTEYDIQVQTSSGRKGKGTTLFRVKFSAEPNIALAYAGGNEQVELFTLDANGTELGRLAGGASNSPTSIAWLPDGSGVVWTQRIIKGAKQYSEIKYVDKSGSEALTLLEGDRSLNLWVGERDTIDTATGGCGTSARWVYFIAFNQGLDGHKDIFRFSFDGLAAPQGVIVDATQSYIGLAVSKDGTLLATFTYVSGGHPNRPDSELQIRDLCTPGVPVLWSWTAQELGLPVSGDEHPWIDVIDWSHDGRLAVLDTGYQPNEVWIIDPFSNDGAAPLVTRMTGPGTGFLAPSQKQSVAWSPQGDIIAFVAWTSSLGTTIYSMDVATGSVRTLGGHSPDVLDWRDNWTADP